MNGHTPTALISIPAIVCALASPLAAQAPRAEPVNPALAPDPGNDLFQRAKNLYDTAKDTNDLENRTNLYQRAGELFSNYVSEFPDHPNAEPAWFYLGNSSYQSGQVEDAKRCFSTLINRYGKGKWVAAAAYTLAADHYNKGEYQFAAPLFERYAANAAKPEDRPRGNQLAASCYRQMGRDREAAALFRSVIADPAGALFVPQAKLGLAHMLAKDGKLPESLAAFEELVAAPHPAKIRGEAALQAGIIATTLGKNELAERYLALVLKTPGMEDFRPDAQTALMGNLFSQKRYKEVIDTYNANPAKAAGEKESVRLMLAGRSMMRLKRASEALALFREVERLVKPQSDMAFDASYYRLLCFFEIEGKHVPDQVDAFLTLYRKSRPEDPKIHTALMMKAESLYASKKIEEAANIYSQINPTLVGEKNRAGLLYQRGWCLSEAGDAQGAAKSFSDFINKYPGDARIPSALAKRAKAYMDSEDPQKAIGDFDRLIGAGKPADLVSFAWLESARMRRTESNIPDMITRYQGLLKNVEDLNENLQGEANYWIGWGMVKTNSAKDAVAYLEKARELRPDAYRKHAGILLVLGYFAAQDITRLSAEIKLAIEGKYESEIPDQILQWAGMQAYNANDYALAAQCLSLIAKPDDARATPKEIWRYLAKARLETKDPAGALAAADNVLAVEDNPAWKADGLLDRGKALLALDRAAESRKAAEDAMALRPQGRTTAALRILTGDLDMKANDPKRASAEYLVVVNFHEDKELKPLALAKLVKALETQGDKAEAEKYRQQLATEFPGWKER